MPVALLAHVVTAGPGVLGLPLWALSYLVLMVVGVVALVLRSRLGRPAAASRGGPGPAGAMPGWLRLGGRLVAAVLLGVTLFLAWAGPVQQGGNLAPLLVMSIFWVGLGWLSVLAGDVWTDWSPLGLAARGDRRDAAAPADVDADADADADADSTATTGWWWAPLVLFTFLVGWVADPDGSQPRRIGAWLVVFVLVGAVGAWAGRRRFLDRYDPFPHVFAFVAWFRPRRGRPADDRAVLALGALVAAAVTFDRLTRSIAWSEVVGRRSTVVAALENSFVMVWLAAAFAALAWGAGRLGAASGRRGADDARPGGLLYAPVVGPIAGAVVLTRTLNAFLVQVQNLVVLASDPLGRGSDLFGTVTWRIDQQPLGPVASGWVQLALIVVGHAAAMAVVGDRCVRGAPPGTPARLLWRSMLPGVALVAVSGVAFTLALLGS